MNVISVIIIVFAMRYFLPMVWDINLFSTP
jgi:hypothetical protein